MPTSPGWVPICSNAWRRSRGCVCSARLRATTWSGSASFALDGVHAHDVSEILDRHAVCDRAGHHCAQVLMDRLGVPATARASLALYNTREEVDRLIEALHDVRHVFKLD